MFCGICPYLSVAVTVQPLGFISPSYSWECLFSCLKFTQTMFCWIYPYLSVLPLDIVIILIYPSYARRCLSSCLIFTLTRQNWKGSQGVREITMVFHFFNLPASMCYYWNKLVTLFWTKYYTIGEILFAQSHLYLVTLLSKVVPDKRPCFWWVCLSRSSSHDNQVLVTLILTKHLFSVKLTY